MRDTAFDTRVHDFEVSESGIRIGETVDEAEGLLSGSDPRIISRTDRGDGR